MFIPQSWIAEIVRGPENVINPDWSVTPDELDEGFVRVGLETEGHEPLEKIESPLVFGCVDHVGELEDFKKSIHFCQANVGDADGTGKLQEITRGAHNFEEGSIVVVALPGYVLPGGFEIPVRKTHGKISNGMLCSEAELGMTDSSAGILTLPSAPAELGSCVKELIGLGEEKLEVNITPDRGYALSIRSLGHEICPAFSLDFADPVKVKELPVEGEILDVTIDEDIDTRRSDLRHVTDINLNTEAPRWMRRRLLLTGQRPINVVTDVINYVMLPLSQPMHVLDGFKIIGDLYVRNIKAGETLTTLDHVDCKLGPADVIIYDDNGIQPLAGIIGGLTSEIADDTTDVVLEVVNWSPLHIFRSDRRHKLSSEASRRFERGVGITFIESAPDLACQLLVDIAGGIIDTGRTLLDEVITMLTTDFVVNYVSEIAGVNYPYETVIGRLREVGCEVVDNGDRLAITPPTWRSGLTMSADLVEEILRLEGLEDVPATLPIVLAGRGLTERQLCRRFVGHAPAHNDYLEILPAPLIANDVSDVWGLNADDPHRNTVKVTNLLESDHAQLDTTLLPSMLESLKRNVVRGQADLSFYGVEQVSTERGSGVSPMPSAVDLPSEVERVELLDSLPEQSLHTATVAYERICLDSPWGDEAAYIVADAIEAARIVVRAANVELEIRNTEVSLWYPGRCAELLIDGHVIGHAGELYPKVCKDAGLPEWTCATEINLDALPVTEHLPAPVFSPFPAVHQDVAFVVSDEVSTVEVEKTLIEGAGEFLESIRAFDIYRSEQMGESVRSLVYSLRFRTPNRTLKEEEASAAREVVIDLATTRHDAQLCG